LEQGDALPKLRSKIAGFLDASGMRYAIDAEQDFAVTVDPLTDAVVWCIPRQLEGTENLIVTVMCIMNVGVRVDDDLKRYLTAANNRQLFGRFIINQDQPTPAVLFVHALLGDFLDRAELEAAVWAVARSAHSGADEIKRRWGGRKFTEPGP
jgi:hypothetical protein